MGKDGRTETHLMGRSDCKKRLRDLFPVRIMPAKFGDFLASFSDACADFDVILFIL
jgi:hypothetical protein